jgi:hypothetical protein
MTSKRFDGPTPLDERTNDGTLADLRSLPGLMQTETGASPLQLANIALAIAFIVAALFSPGGKVVDAEIGLPALQSIPPYQGQLLLAFADVWIPAVLFYLLLRLVWGGNWLRSSYAVDLLLGYGNVLLAGNVAMHALATTLPGAENSRVFVAYAALAPWVTYSMLTVGLGWLLVRSAVQVHRPLQSGSGLPGFVECLGFIAAAGVPCAMVAHTMFLAENAPLGLAMAAAEKMQILCSKAGETIVQSPRGVESVYFEPNWGEEFGKIENGLFAGKGGQMLGEIMLREGRLKYFEKRNPNARTASAGYLRQSPGNLRGEPEAKPTSEYAVIQKVAVSKFDEQNLSLYGKEITVMKLATGKPVAKLVYFTSERNRTICGQSANGRLDVADFVRRALNLAPRFLRSAPQPAMKPL